MHIISPHPLYPPLLERKGGGIERRGCAPSNFPNERPWALNFLPALKGVGESNVVGVFQFGAEGQSSSEAGNPDAQG